MSIHFIDPAELWFPDENQMGNDIVAAGGDLSPERLLLAYSMGIFPWYNKPGDIFWWCPEERAVLLTDQLHISRSMRQVITKEQFTWTIDKAFSEVVEGCRSGSRSGDTWILDETVKAYTRLHQMGYAHSVEVWETGQLVGGLYGISLGKVFFGESMFTRRPNASKFGLIKLAQFLDRKGWRILDCQVANAHTSSMGAQTFSRKDFLELLNKELKHPTIRGNWGSEETWL